MDTNASEPPNWVQISLDSKMFHLPGTSMVFVVCELQIVANPLRLMALMLSICHFAESQLSKFPLSWLLKVKVLLAMLVIDSSLKSKPAFFPSYVILITLGMK